MYSFSDSRKLLYRCCVCKIWCIALLLKLTFSIWSRHTWKLATYLQITLTTYNLTDNYNILKEVFGGWRDYDATVFIWNDDIWVFYTYL